MFSRAVFIFNQMNPQAPIGIFDSGVGGTSIWKEIHSLMPAEHTLYLADSAHAPYGNKSRERIIELSEKNTRYLLDAGAKIVVVACNTATTNAISYLRQRYDVPFIGIEPAIKPAALKTHTGVVGILATKGTLNSELFHQTAQGHASGIETVEVIGEGLVPLIEAGQLDSPEMIRLLETYLQPMLEAKADHIVLGCSHYPYLIPTLQKLVPEGVRLIDSGAAVARQTKAVLQQHGGLNHTKRIPNLEFLTNGEIDTLELLLQDQQANLKIEKGAF